MFQEDLTGDVWKDLVIQQRYNKANEKELISSENMAKAPKDRVILFGGFEDGSLSVIKWRGRKNRGKVTFTMQVSFIWNFHYLIIFIVEHMKIFIKSMHKRTL